MSRPKTITARAVPVAAALLLVAACSTPGSSSTDSTSAATSAAGSAAGSAASSGAVTGDPIKVGVVTSLSGPLQSYGQTYLDAFTVCLDDATGGTGVVNGRKIEVTTADDAADPAKATSAVTDFIGQGYKIIAGSASSGVAAQ